MAMPVSGTETVRLPARLAISKVDATAYYAAGIQMVCRRAKHFTVTVFWQKGLDFGIGEGERRLGALQDR